MNTIELPLRGIQAGFRRFSVAEYHRLIDMKVLGEDDDLELIDGYLVRKMAKNPPHESAMQRLEDLIRALLDKAWMVRCQKSVTLLGSEPEPDLSIVLRQPDVYDYRHPLPSDFGIVVEVADSSLASDRQDKQKIYALDKIPVYWIVNLVERIVEVYGEPTGRRKKPAYLVRTDHREGYSVPVVLDGREVGRIAVSEILPRRSELQSSIE